MFLGVRAYVIVKKINLQKYFQGEFEVLKNNKMNRGNEFVVLVLLSIKGIS